MPKHRFAKEKKHRKPQTALAKLNIRQRKFLKLYLKTGNASQSALDAGFANREESIRQLTNANVQHAFQQLLDKEGITDGKLVETLKDGLEANKVISARVIIQKDKPTSQADGELPLADNKTDDFIEVPDHPTRHKFLETGLKVKGRIEKQQIDVKVAGEVKHTFEVVRYNELPIKRNELPTGRGKKKHNPGS